jgi:YhcH/YjgK/YiaL family protein
MVVDRIENASSYYALGARFEKALRWLAATHVRSLPVGKVEIDGADVVASVNEIDPKTTDGAKWEAHRRYADIQYLIEGDERIGYTHVSRASSLSYDERKDFDHLAVTDGMYVRMVPGAFAVLLPQDAHQPGVGGVDGQTGRIRKIVVKIRL